MFIQERHGRVPASPRKAPRTLHLIDLENLAGSPDFSSADADAVRRSYDRTVGIGPDDLVIVAASHYSAPAAWFGWPNVRRLVRSGPNGADLALLQVVANERIAERFSSIIVASGDGIFAEAAARLQAAGCTVTA